MRIGTQYADNKMYRGVEYLDGMPLTSGDLHESSDTLYMKNAYLMNNLLGYGTVNSPLINIQSDGIHLVEPSVVMIDGDISLIQSDTNTPIVSKSTISSAGYREGIIAVLGWYQYIDYSSTMRNYGGVDNSTLDNDLINTDFDLAISNRYQFRWFPVVLSRTDVLSDSIEITVNSRDITGEKLQSEMTLQSNSKVNQSFVFDKPNSMDYAKSDLYLVPIASYTYESSSIVESHAIDKLKVGSQFVTSTVEPTEMLQDGMRWYNPSTREFKTYIASEGEFVDSASKMAFFQYQSTYTVQSEVTTPTNIPNIPIGITAIQVQESDLIRVIYEGLELSEGIHYSINYTNKTITLLNFKVSAGDLIMFVVTRVVDAPDITNITETFVSHLESTSNATVKSHVKLSDTLSNSDVSGGIAATPKLVKDAIESAVIMTDEVTGARYTFGVENGTLYAKEV